VAEPYIGEIRLFPYNFAPRGWLFCQGQLLPIAANTALFSVLGTTYGGNGQTTFGLPDLRGRAPISAGQGPGLTDYTLGEQVGVETVTLSLNQMPVHQHALNASNQAADSSRPGDAYLAGGGAYAQTSDGTLMGGNSIGLSVGGQAHENRPPRLVLNWCIATAGLFPSRN
jgi:microcystin-dependent protein